MRIAALAGTVAVLLLRAQAQSPAAPIPIKVVVVTMFERGEDTGDGPGEFQFWVEREHLDQVVPLTSGYHHVRINKNGVLGLLTGVGTAKAAASVMALGTTLASTSRKPTGWWRASAAAIRRMSR